MTHAGRIPNDQSEVVQGQRYEEVQWEAPTTPWYKVNSDAAIFAKNNSTGVGVIIWDHDGHVKVTINKSLPLLLGPLEVEAKTLE